MAAVAAGIMDIMVVAVAEVREGLVGLEVAEADLAAVVTVVIMEVALEEVLVVEVGDGDRTLNV